MRRATAPGVGLRREKKKMRNMRVIAGTFKGRRLKAPSWEGLRPTSDTLRETLFNILAPRIDGARVLDGYAGTGAIGIEALSRGASHVAFVERDRRAQAPLFSIQERVEIAREVFKDQRNVEVDTFGGLLVDYVEARKAQVIVRGLRAVSDFEFEFQMALMNRRLNSKIETVFMMPAEQYTYISSRLIKEVFALGGGVHGLVPDLVEQRLRQKD